MNKLLAATALAIVFTAPAFAETATTVPKTETAPPTGAMAPNKSDVLFYSEQNDWRASHLMGLTVKNAANESIGDINEILIDKDGRVAAIVIGVGGFLGMGERHAAVAYSALQLSRDKDGRPLARVNLTKEQLKSAPEWKWQAASAN